ncbi:hypothetical protein DID73_01865 [Candidatus Marinamargulisbacteria bacterium SCGC AG-343-K17]|nr:hypothetical protein DID73_01865 [Candidatus Marinamargulisbacteria bacterium SCGC AG-343-K17]
MKKVIFGCLFVLMASFLAQANYLEKTSLEENIQIKAQHILDTMYGPHNFSVSVTVDMGRESWAVSYTERAKVEFEETQNTPGEKYKILPGYSAIKNLSPNEAVQMPFNSKITKLAAPVIKITLDVVTSKKISKQDVKAADKVMTKILMLNTERGDAINFVFEDFPVNKNVDEVKVGLPIEAKLMIFVLIITSLFLIVYILLKIKQLNINKEAVKAQQETAKATAAAAAAGGGGSSGPDPTPEAAPVPQAAGGGSDDVGGYFSFVGPHNANQFVDVIKKNELPVEKLAIVLSYLNPSYSKMVMDTLEEAQQVEIITALTEEKIADKAELDELEGALKSQLECSVGGASKLGAVIATFNDASKKTFLSSVESNAEIYKKIRPDIFMFEDIEKLEDGDVKKLIGAVNIEVLAASIATDDSAASGKLKSNLTGAAEAMVTQFIDLKKESLSENDVANAQSQVVQQMKVLSNQGAIDLVSKLVS